MDLRVVFSTEPNNGKRKAVGWMVGVCFLVAADLARPPLHSPGSQLSLKQNPSFVSIRSQVPISSDACYPLWRFRASPVIGQNSLYVCLSICLGIALCACLAFV